MPTHYPQLSHSLQQGLLHEFNELFPDYLEAYEVVNSKSIEDLSKWLLFWWLRKPIINGDPSRATPEIQIRLNICEHAINGILEKASKCHITPASIEIFINSNEPFTESKTVNIDNNNNNSKSNSSKNKSSVIAPFHIFPPANNNRKTVYNYTNAQKIAFLTSRNLYSYHVRVYFKDTKNSDKPHIIQFECPKDASEDDFVRQIFYNIAEDLAELTHVECTQQYVKKESDFSPFLRNHVNIPKYEFTANNPKWYRFWSRFLALLLGGESLDSSRLLQISTTVSVKAPQPLLLKQEDE